MQVETEALVQQTRDVFDFYAQAHARHAIFAGPTEHREQERRSHPVPSELFPYPNTELRRLRVDEARQMIGARPLTHPSCADPHTLPVSCHHRQVPCPPPTLEHFG